MVNKDASSKEEEEMIVKHLQWCARSGFAADDTELKAVLAKIVNDGRPPSFKSGLPSDDATRSFRALHPELRFRRPESKEDDKHKGGNYYDVLMYANVLRNVQQDHSGIFEKGGLVWNMDETHVGGEFGERKIVYSCADTHHGGFKKTAAAGHVTIFFAVYASGKRAPPFFIVEGKRNMSNWYLHIDETLYNLRDGHLEVLNDKGWFPSDSCLVMAENWSMEKAIIPIFMKHLNTFVRNIVPEDKHYVLLLDGQSSRKVLEWLELGLTMNCSVVQSPANTPHFLQSCDMIVNKKFKAMVRSKRDALCAAGNSKAGMRTIQMKRFH